MRVASGQERRNLDADAQPPEKPPPQLIRYLEESKKDGHFTNLQVNPPGGDGETAFIGSWAEKDGKAV